MVQRRFTAILTVCLGEVEARNEIEFDFDRGYRASGPTYSCAGEPGEPPSVEIISAVLLGENDNRMAALDDDAIAALQSNESVCEELIEIALTQGSDT